jgi:predicted phage-related endonuclease
MKFTQADVNKIFVTPYSTLKLWEGRGFYQSAPIIEDHRGIQREYSKLNLYQIGLVEVLVRKLRVKPEQIQILMRNLFFINGENEQKIAEIFNSYFLSIAVKDSLDADLKRSDEIISKDFSTMFRNLITTVINLQVIKDKIDDAIKKLEK